MNKKRKHITRSNMIVCSSCGADFDEMSPACPFCGTASIKGAEAEYMARLGDVREDLAELKNVPLEETKQAFKKQGRFTAIVIGIICFVLLVFSAGGYLLSRLDERDRVSDYLWQLENFAMLDEMYTNNEFEQLVAFYEEAREQELPISDWKHWWFVFRLSGFMYAEEILEREAQGGELGTSSYQLLMYYEMCAKYMHMDSGITEEERIKLEPYIQRLCVDFDSRWNFSEEELKAIEEEVRKDSGMPSFKTSDKYTEKWMKRENIK